MNHIDLILIFLFFLFFAIGWKIRGIYLIFLPIAFFAGIILANATYPFFAKIFFKTITNESKKIILSYLTAFICFASITIIAGILISKFFDSLNLTIFDKLLGGLILVLITLIPVYFIFNIFVDMNLFGFKTSVKASLLFPLMEKYVLLILKIPVFKIIKMHFLTLFSKKIII